jgi:predicted dehydrogenase
MNGGSHFLDQLLQVVGYDVKRVFADLKLVAALGDADDVAKVIVETKRGLIGELDLNQASTIAPYALQAWGTRGAIELSSDLTKFAITSVRQGDLPAKGLNRALASQDRLYPVEDRPLQPEVVSVDPSLEVDIYANFAAAIRRGAPLFIRPEESVAAMRLIDRCREDSGPIRRMRPRHK